jgi:hypothetical protein
MAEHSPGARPTPPEGALPDGRSLHEYHTALLLSHLREAGARHADAPPAPVAAPDSAGAELAVAWDRFNRHLLAAEQNAHIGTAQPGRHYRGWKRTIARLVFVLDSLRDLQDSIRALEQALADMKAGGGAAAGVSRPQGPGNSR